MKPERWKQVDELLEAALDCPANERASFLDLYKPSLVLRGAHVAQKQGRG